MFCLRSGLFVLLLISLQHFSRGSNGSLVNYYEELINSEIEKSKTYRLDTNAKRYKAIKQGITDLGVYDFIVIGAGSAGSIVASRLSEISEWNVLLLEAGGYSNDFTSIPNMFARTLSSDYNWAYKSIPQTTGCLGQVNRQCLYYRGRGVGGSSLVNNLVYARGSPGDYDLWAKMGNDGWSFTDVLPYFKKSEDFNKNNPEAPVAAGYHGTGGYVGVEYRDINPLVTAFIEGNQDLGYNLTDNNGPSVDGDTPTQFNTRNGRRQDTGTTCIKPFLERKNLKVLTNAYVTRITINENNEATGVELTYDKQSCVATIRKEVILSAGTVASPQILMLSGVGPKRHLEMVDIPVKKHLDVGSKLRDHLIYFGLAFSSNWSIPSQTLREQIREFINGKGPLTISGPYQSVGFYQSSLEKKLHYPDIEFIFVPPANASSIGSRERIYNFGDWTNETYNSAWADFDPASSFSIAPVVVHTHSYGTLRLKSNDPFDYPLIDAKPLSDENDHDIQVLYEGIQLALELSKTKAFKKFKVRLSSKPFPKCKHHKFLTKEYWYCAIRLMGLNSYHPVGSCQMGPDPKKGAVVNSKLRVYGIAKLRIADASVIPVTVSGHTNAPSMMVGEKAADIIKKTYNIRLHS